MKTYVINLESRPDRLSNFEKVNDKHLEKYEVFPAFQGREWITDHASLLKLGFDTDKDWRDPILGRTITKGEIGCLISHYQLWEMCAQGEENFAILEDDAILETEIDSLEKTLEAHDLVYLCYNEMLSDGVEILPKVGEVKLIKPCYPYWTVGYLLTPEGARALINTDIKTNIIPADEYLPRMSDKISIAATSHAVLHPIPRDQGGTDVEPNDSADYFKDFTTHALTCGSEADLMEDLTRSAFAENIEVKNIFKIGEDTWVGSDMSGPGGGQKLNLLRRYIDENQLPDNDVILFTDAYDVFFYRDLDEILARFIDFKSEIVFSAEKYLWPDESLRFPASETPYRYLNSGTFIGRVGEIKHILSAPIKDADDDQLYLQKAFLSGRYKAVLDTECYIFQTNESACVEVDGTVYNPITRCFSCIYHGNGGEEAKETFSRLYKSVYRPVIYDIATSYTKIGEEMLLVDFMSPEQCEQWIQISETHGGWNPHPDDRFPSHDIHLKELGLWDEVEDHWKRVIAPVAERYWAPYAHYHLRKAFTMKYSADTQKTLGLHTDASLVTGSVKLNNDYDGATLVFPRQNVTNKDIPIGKMILFPGQVTHGHYVTELTKGTKYSATFWTARYSGDILNPE